MTTAHVAAPLTSVLLLPAAAFAFLLPGWLLHRLIPSPSPVATVWVGSCILSFAAVLGFHAAGIPLERGPMALGIAAVSTLFAFLALRRPQPDRTGLDVAQPVGPLPLCWLIPCAVGLVSLVVRTILDPLSGFDNGFRWDYLARLMVSQRSLSGYPPVTAADFEYYSWCDSIPPLVASLNFQIYTFTGSIAPTLTTIRVLGEALVIAALVFSYSQLLWGGVGGFVSIAILASSALALWAVAIGQETGLTTISMLMLLYFLELNRRTPSRSLLFWAALGAALGALSREYGLSFLALGSGVLIAQKRPLREAWFFGSIAAGLAAPWYVRTWLLTGNPIFPMSLGGLLPGNQAHEAVMNGIAQSWGVGGQLGEFVSFMAMFIAVGALVPTVAGVIGAGRASRLGLPLVAGIGLVLFLWLLSLPYTGAGWAYSTRVLLPALAMLSILSGWLTLQKRTFQWSIAALVIAVSVDAARRSWFLPVFPFIHPAHTSFVRWKEINESIDRISGHPMWGALVNHADGRGIIVDHPANHVLITLRGGRAIPIFSPVLEPTYSEFAEREQTLAYLARHDVGVVALPLGQTMNASVIRNYRFWSALFADYEPNAIVDQLHIYDLADLRPRTK